MNDEYFSYFEKRYLNPLSDEQIENNRNQLARCVGNTNNMNVNTLSSLFGCLDNMYFNGEIQKILIQKQKNLTFLPHTRNVPDKSQIFSGYTERTKDKNYVIHVNVEIVQQAMNKNHKSKTGGLLCYSTFNCVLLTMQHELLHMAEFMNLMPHLNAHNHYFKIFLKNMFGHISMTHDHIKYI